MTVLPDNDRFNVWAEFMRGLSAEKEKLDIGKADLRAAVNAVDIWINDNAVSFNAALPAVAQSSLTTKQKVRLFVAVVKRRFEVA